MAERDDVRERPQLGARVGGGVVEVRSWLALLLVVLVPALGFAAAWGASRSSAEATSSSVGELKSDVLGAITSTEQRLTRSLSELRSQVEDLRAQSETSRADLAGLQAQLDALRHRADQLEAKDLSYEEWHGAISNQLAKLLGRLEESKRQREES